MLNLRPNPLVSGIVALAALLSTGVFPGTASAQTAAFVRVVNETQVVRRSSGDVLLQAAQGTVLEALARDGDWYWVLTPRDDNGTSRAGWIPTSEVQPLSANEIAELRRGTGSAGSVASAESRSLVPDPRASGGAPSKATDVARTSSPVDSNGVSRTGAAEPGALREVVVHFQFGKSDLLEDAKKQISAALAELKDRLQGVSFQTEGYADAIGPEVVNDQLGLARARAVTQYLAEQHQIPMEKMNVASYGEHRPVASNTTKAGRAQNRRVVVKIVG